MRVRAPSAPLIETNPPRSILFVPPLNASPEVGASRMYLSTITRPLVERGYYVFPVAMVEARHSNFVAWFIALLVSAAVQPAVNTLSGDLSRELSIEANQRLFTVELPPGPYLRAPGTASSMTAAH